MRTLPWFKGWFTPNKIEVSNQPLDVDLLIDKILSNDIFKEMITASSSGNYCQYSQQVIAKYYNDCITIIAESFSMTNYKAQGFWP